MANVKPEKSRMVLLHVTYTLRAGCDPGSMQLGRVNVRDEEVKMPDGVIIHPRLAGRYWPLYAQLLEDVWGEEALAREAVERIKRDVQNYGSGPIELLKQAAAQFAPLSTSRRFGQAIDWSQERRTLEEVAAQITAGSKNKKRAISIAREACEGYITELRKEPYQANGNSLQAYLELIRGYLLKIYDANFINRIPLPRHLSGGDEDLVLSRAQEIRPLVIRDIQYLALQIAQDRPLAALRMPRRSRRPKMIDIHSDLKDL